MCLFCMDWTGRANLPFRIATEHFECLGVAIHGGPELQFKLNFAELWNRLGGVIGGWRLLPVSLVGRVDIVRMITLLRFVYLFWNLPFFLAASFFGLVDLVLVSFIWAGGAPLVSGAHLRGPPVGGVALVCLLRDCCWACGAGAFVFWHQGGGQ